MAALRPGLKLVVFFLREHHLKLWIIIKDNEWTNFVLNEGLKIEIVKDISHTSVLASYVHEQSQFYPDLDLTNSRETKE